MISLFRKYLTSWFALGILGLVLVAFAFTGVGNTSFGGATSSGVATVGGQNISEAKLLTEFDRAMRRARQQDPKLDVRAAARQGAVGDVYEQLIATTALEKFGANSGIAISDRAIDGEIASVDAFRVNGKFDQATYKNLLAAQRLSERDLRDGLHGDLIRKQLVTPVIAATQVPRSMAAPYAALLLERRTGSVAIIPTTAMPVPLAPTDAQLTSYYASHAAQYTVPERRGFRFASLDRDKIAAGVEVTDAQIKKYYDDNQETYGGAEQRKLAQVVVPEEAKANALAAAVKGGQTFATAAAAAGFAAADTDIGQQTKTKFAAATSSAVADAAFAVPAKGITAPVKSPFGWHVVETVAIIPAHSRSLADARDEIVAKLKSDRTDQLLADTVGKIEDALSSRTSFADVAKQYGLAIVAVPPVTRTGTNPADPAYTVPPAAAPLVTKAFDADPADGASLAQLGKAQFAILELGDIVPPSPVPLAKVRAAVTAAWIGDARMRSAKAVADAVIAEVAGGKAFDAALAAHKLPAARPLNGRRIDLSNQQQVPPPVQAFLLLGAGKSRAIPAGAQGYWVVHVDTVTPGDVAAAPQLVDSARAQFAQSTGDEIGAAFAQSVEAELGVRRNAAGLAAATTRIVGTAPAQ
ncbi:SurA N-terminal domain-containing protein [Polymorphobacter sp. PAMC 29334]|uniref:peptidylprolyl isomerase n=1 Tax=Polymorphobacter sp. PAMC 29334 TaxID=2862331 RepID=UPI001C742382|nr:peptidylprolyl isomerase [Polymorphobacter sp. PAMC 29334]QYE34044.1 SurA N-terminal domain-containing protein [Polymorphobacter sp. PAMC 29334]